MKVIVSRDGNLHTAQCGDMQVAAQGDPATAIGLMVLNNREAFGIAEILLLDTQDKVPLAQKSAPTDRVYGNGVSAYELTRALIDCLMVQPDKTARRQDVFVHIESVLGSSFTLEDWSPEPNFPEKWQYHWHHRVDTARNTLRRDGMIHPVRYRSNPLGVWTLTPIAVILYQPRTTL